MTNTSTKISPGHSETSSFVHTGELMSKQMNRKGIHKTEGQLISIKT